MQAKLSRPSERGGSSHLLRNALIAVTLAAALTASAALATDPHHASIALDQSDPHLGDTVTFTTDGGSQVQVVCYAGTGVDYVAVQPAGTEFLLGGTDSAWLESGGSAICYAYIGNNHEWFTDIVFGAGGAR